MKKFKLWFQNHKKQDNNVNLEKERKAEAKKYSTPVLFQKFFGLYELVFNYVTLSESQ